MECYLCQKGAVKHNGDTKYGGVEHATSTCSSILGSVSCFYMFPNHLILLPKLPLSALYCPQQPLPAKTTATPAAQSQLSSAASYNVTYASLADQSEDVADLNEEKLAAARAQLKARAAAKGRRGSKAGRAAGSQSHVSTFLLKKKELTSSIIQSSKSLRAYWFILPARSRKLALLCYSRWRCLALTGERGKGVERESGGHA